MAKVVLISNHGLDTVAEKLQSEVGLTEVEAERIRAEYNRTLTDHSTYWAVVKPDDYVLWRGMADIVGDP